MIFPIWTPAYLVEFSLGNCPIQSILCLQVAAEQRRLEAERLRLEASRNLQIQLPSFRWRHDMRSLYFIHMISTWYLMICIYQSHPYSMNIPLSQHIPTYIPTNIPLRLHQYAQNTISHAISSHHHTCQICQFSPTRIPIRIRIRGISHNLGGWDDFQEPPATPLSEWQPTPPIRF